ncbi:hypothetical protein [Rhodobacter lacus]|uniref:Uncharacterized protein n=1 Tax=Rhodobacter lacus TaxID=1641972 RepID=A0ABW5A648_9RHOB
MTAIIVRLGALAQAEAVAGAQWSVPLGSGGIVTHMGCNWVGCPGEITSALEQVDGVRTGEDFFGLCEDLGVAPIAL